MGKVYGRQSRNFLIDKEVLCVKSGKRVQAEGHAQEVLDTIEALHSLVTTPPY